MSVKSYASIIFFNQKNNFHYTTPSRYITLDVLFIFTVDNILSICCFVFKV